MSTTQVKDHFETEAKEFDEIIIKLIPYYDQMISSLIDSIHFDKLSPIRIIDLGCGTGTISKRISEKFPNSKIMCLDISSNMIQIAKHKLSDHKDTEFLLGDFSKIDIIDKYDVVISSLALHHIDTDEDKKKFYTKIYKLLNDSGIFFNADVVLASTNYHQDMYMDRWIEYMKRQVPMEEILSNWIPTYKAEDKPAKLIDQLRWLDEVGYRNVDVIWKYYNFAVYGGMK